jgi:hypothetical protein
LLFALLTKNPMLGGGATAAPTMLSRRSLITIASKPMANIVMKIFIPSS